MSKLKMNCGYCGRKCDLDKDFCIPQDSVYVCKSCYDWQNKVSDSESKLAESELKYNATNRAYWELVEKQDNDFLQYEKLIGENNKLKQQLAEKDKELETYKKQFNEQAGLCEEFRFQLAEKDKEIEYLNKQARKFNNEAQKYFEDAYCNDTIYQDKISFAVEQLEQLRHDIWTNQADDGYTDMQVDLYDLNDTIDVRIMQIKEGK